MSLAPYEAVSAATARPFAARSCMRVDRAGRRQRPIRRQTAGQRHECHVLVSRTRARSTRFYPPGGAQRRRTPDLDAGRPARVAERLVEAADAGRPPATAAGWPSAGSSTATSGVPARSDTGRQCAATARRRPPPTRSNTVAEGLAAGAAQLRRDTRRASRRPRRAEAPPGSRQSGASPGPAGARSIAAWLTPASAMRPAVDA